VILPLAEYERMKENLEMMKEDLEMLRSKKKIEPLILWRWFLLVQPSVNLKN